MTNRSDDDDKTMIAPRTPPPPSDEEKTVFVRRDAPAPAPPAEERTGVRGAPAADPDRTVVRPSGGAPASDPDRTVVRPSGGAPASDPDRTVVRSGGAPAAEDRTVVGGMAAGTRAELGYSILCLSGPAKGQRLPIPPSGASIGSGMESAIRIPGLLSRHAKIDREGDTFVIHAVGGTVTVGGRSVAKGKLQSGDLVKIGDVVARFVRDGEVFSSSYSEAELAAPATPDVGSMLKNPKILAIAGLVVLLVGLLLWPTGEGEVEEAAGPAGPTREEIRAQEIETLIAGGEVLFNAGRLVAPADQPDVDNAYRTFNRVIEMDPGNPRALEWLGKIDAELKRQAGARQEAEQRRLAREREARERARAELQARVDKILAEGDTYFAKGQIAEPAGSNALVFYRQALEVDPQNDAAKDRVRQAVYEYVRRGDAARDKDDLWLALENYRKGARAAGGEDPEIEGRVRETEGRLRSGLAGVGTNLVLYKDERGRLFVLDDMEKVPARYRDRAVTVTASDAPAGGVRPSER